MYGQFFLLFGLIMVGYYCNRKNWLTRETNKNMGSMVMHVTIPAMLITTISGIEISDSMLKGFFLAVAGQIVAMVSFGLLVRAYARWRKTDIRLRPMLDITCASVNSGFIGIPVASIFFGDAGVVYMSAGILGLNMYLWSYGVSVIENKKGRGLKGLSKMLLKIFTNPNCLAILIGLVLTLTGAVRAVPEMLLKLMKSLGDLSTPLSLLYIGALAGSSGLKTLFQERAALEFSLLKMLLMPLLSWAVMLVIPAGGLAKSVFLLEMCLPSAVVVPMMVEEYGYGEKMSSDIVLWTTLLSMITMPVCVWLTGFLY